MGRRLPADRHGRLGNDWRVAVSDPVNPPVEPPFNLVQAIKAQPTPTNDNWDYVREKKKQLESYSFISFSTRIQLAMMMSDEGAIRNILVNLEDAQQFHAIVSRALQNWTVANAANPVQGSLAEVYKEVVSGHQEEPLF